MPKFNTKKIVVSLSSPDGNAFAIMGNAVREMRKAGATEQDIAEYRGKATSGDYENLLAVTAEYVNLKTRP